MSEEFDPYHRWLAISPQEQPADHYRLLGCQPLEDNADVIESAADRQMAHVRGFQSGAHADDAQRLLNELAAAKLVLLKPAEKAAYDAQLQTQRDRAHQKRRQEQKLATAQPLESSPADIATARLPPSRGSAQAVVPAGSAGTSLSQVVGASGPAIQIHASRKSGLPSIVVFAGIAAAVAILLIGGAVAMVVKSWAAGETLAHNNDPEQPQAIITRFSRSHCVAAAKTYAQVHSQQRRLNASRAITCKARASRETCPRDYRRIFNNSSRSC